MPLNKLLKSTHLRFAIALTAVFAVIYLLVGWFAFLAVDTELRERVSQADLVNSSGFAEIYRNSGRSALVEAVRSSSESDETDDSFAWLGTRNGERLAGPALTAPRALQTGDVAGRSLLPELDEGYHIRVTDLDDLRLITGVSHEESEEILGFVSLAFGAAALLTLLLASLAGLALARQGQRRIDAASGMLDRVAAGELTRRLPVSGSGDDIDQLSTWISSTRRLRGFDRSAPTLPTTCARRSIGLEFISNGSVTASVLIMLSAHSSNWRVQKFARSSPLSMRSCGSRRSKPARGGRGFSRSIFQELLKACSMSMRRSRKKMDRLCSWNRRATHRRGFSVTGTFWCS